MVDGAFQAVVINIRPAEQGGGWNGRRWTGGGQGVGRKELLHKSTLE